MTINSDSDEEERNRYNGSLRRKTRASILWTLVRIASDQVFSFLVFVTLARLLSRDEIGIFALAYAVAEVGRIIATGGMVQNIARAKTMSPELRDTVFWTNLTLAMVVALAGLALARPIAHAIGQPDAAGPLMALGFVMPVAALGATHLALRLREFGHKTLALRSVVGGLIGGGAAVAAALSGWGVWSLVVQRFVTEAVNTVMSWRSFQWSPGRNFSRQQLREIAGFGTNLTITQLIFLLLVRAQDIIIGAAISSAAVGSYRTAWRTTELITNGAIQPFTSVAIQTLSRLQGDHKGLVDAYRWMISTSAIIAFPALVGFGVIAPDAVPAIYGAKWVEAGQLAQIFAFMVVPFTLNYFASPVLAALGHGADMRNFSDHSAGPDPDHDAAGCPVRHLRRRSRLCRAGIPHAAAADLDSAAACRYHRRGYVQCNRRTVLRLCHNGRGRMVRHGSNQAAHRGAVGRDLGRRRSRRCDLRCLPARLVSARQEYRAQSTKRVVRCQSTAN